MSTATVEPPVDIKAGFSTNCRAGNHSTCQTIGAKCSCACHGKNGNRPPTFECEDCGKVVPNAQGLGAHRKAAHGVAGKTPAIAGKPKKPSAPVLIELVDEDPPPPVLKPIKIPDIDRILAVIEEADMEPGKWKRCAIFISSRAARSMATRLRKRTEGGPYEWYAPGDDRLFVRVTPTA